MDARGLLVSGAVRCGVVTTNNNTTTTYVVGLCAGSRLCEGCAGRSLRPGAPCWLEILEPASRERAKGLSVAFGAFRGRKTKTSCASFIQSETGIRAA